MPEHMLRWRSAAMLIRLYAPEVMLGIQSAEEVEDATQSAPRDVTPLRQVESSAQPAGLRPSGPPRLAAAKPAPAAEQPAPTQEHETAPTAEDDVEAVLAQFENEVLLARTDQDIADCEDALTPYAEADRLSRAQRNRVENAAEAARERIKANAASEQDQEPDEEAAVDPNDPDFKKGVEAAKAGQKRCVITAIREDEARFAKWKAGFDSVEGEG